PLDVFGSDCLKSVQFEVLPRVGETSPLVEGQFCRIVKI
ncbi:MAG: hypothetical protein ACI93B_001880, partial [Yoonia sp.]